MKLSTKVRYGTRAMLDLAVHYGKGPVLLKDIAQRQEISVKYLDSILASLKASGLVVTVRGAKGGYALSEAPSKIAVIQIVEALEGPLELVGCIADNGFCHRVNSCVTHDIWYELEKAMEGVLRSTTLEDLIIRDKRKNQLSEKMYYI
ncbi:MAG: RrF2 family transcriptional regulator [Candidatus Omnitrophica bacterium]|nr:RrF2 family transcriptional regulator [Candidatus Omnitrophota bacterium]